MNNTRDPRKMPISDYYQSKTGITMDDSAETAANYWLLITKGGPAQPNGATAICSRGAERVAGAVGRRTV